MIIPTMQHELNMMSQLNVDLVVREVEELYKDIHDRLHATKNIYISNSQKELILQLVSISHDRIKALLGIYIYLHLLHFFMYGFYAHHWSVSTYGYLSKIL